MSKESNFLENAKKYEELSEQLKPVREALEASMNELGIGSYVQDSETGLVYKVVKPTGTFIYYRDIDYTRTAKATERAGTLSKKEAEEAGFTVLKK